MSLKLERDPQIEERVSINSPKAAPKIGSIMWGILIVAALAEISYGTINFSATPVLFSLL